MAGLIIKVADCRSGTTFPGVDGTTGSGLYAAIEAFEERAIHAFHCESAKVRKMLGVELLNAINGVI
jgi:hypothetical protein